MRNRGSERVAGFSQGHTVNHDHAPGCVRGAFCRILSRLLTISSWFQVSFSFPGLDALWGSAWPHQSLYPQPPDAHSDLVDCEGSAVKFISPLGAPPPAPQHQQGQSSTGQPPGDGHCGFTAPCSARTPALPGKEGLAPMELLGKFHLLSLGSITDGLLSLQFCPGTGGSSRGLSEQPGKPAPSG